MDPRLTTVHVARDTDLCDALKIGFLVSTAAWSFCLKPEGSYWSPALPNPPGFTCETRTCSFEKLLCLPACGTEAGYRLDGNSSFCGSFAVNKLLFSVTKFPTDFDGVISATFGTHSSELVHKNPNVTLSCGWNLRFSFVFHHDNCLTWHSYGIILKNCNMRLDLNCLKSELKPMVKQLFTVGPKTVDQPSFTHHTSLWCFLSSTCTCE